MAGMTAYTNRATATAAPSFCDSTTYLLHMARSTAVSEAMAV